MGSSSKPDQVKRKPKRPAGPAGPWHPSVGYDVQLAYQSSAGILPLNMKVEALDTYCIERSAVVLRSQQVYLSSALSGELHPCDRCAGLADGQGQHGSSSNATIATNCQPQASNATALICVHSLQSERANCSRIFPTKLKRSPASDIIRSACNVHLYQHTHLRAKD